jgi:hypothetical protein
MKQKYLKWFILDNLCFLQMSQASPLKESFAYSLVVVHSVIKSFQPGPPPISLARIIPQKTHLMWLKMAHIMNPTENPVDVPKTKNATEGDKVNVIMPTISHPMNLISIPIPEICGMELG